MAATVATVTKVVERRLKIAIMVCAVGEDRWIQLSAGTWLRKIEGTATPAYNPEHTSFDVYRVMDGNHQGKSVYRTGKSIENFLQEGEEE